MKKRFFFLIFEISSVSWAFDNAKVLPKGVRNISVKNVESTIEQKTSASGQTESLSKPLEKPLTLQKIVDGEVGLKKVSLEGFLLYNGFSLSDSMGEFLAQMKGQIHVTAPIISYGITNDLTLAIAVPFYQAAMAIDMAFRSSERADRFIGALHAEEQNQTLAAREASSKMANAVGELNQKLEQNGYKPISSYSKSGLGDMTIAGKYRALDQDLTKLALSFGFVLPTGKSQDPNRIGDIPFGDDNFDIFGAVLWDQFLQQDFFVNTSLKYSYQTVAKKRMRLITEDEFIEAPLANVRYKAGDKFDGQFSFQYEPSNGLIAGIGYLLSTKDKDMYDLDWSQRKAKEKAEKDTDEKSHYGEAKIGYSTIHSFRSGNFPFPLLASLEYRKHIASRNTVIKDMMIADISVFF